MHLLTICLVAAAVTSASLAFEHPPPRREKHFGYEVKKEYGFKNRRDPHEKDRYGNVHVKKYGFEEHKPTYGDHHDRYDEAPKSTCCHAQASH